MPSEHKRVYLTPAAQPELYAALGIDTSNSDTLTADAISAQLGNYAQLIGGATHAISLTPAEWEMLALFIGHRTTPPAVGRARAPLSHVIECVTLGDRHEHGTAPVAALLRKLVTRSQLDGAAILTAVAWRHAHPDASGQWWTADARQKAVRT